MAGTPRTILNPYESAALTRLVMSFCLGKGSLCLYSRCYVLQIAQPNRAGDYAHYQWRRICQFIPTAKAPRFHPLGEPLEGEGDDRGQWRLRITSRWFETAYNMLYPLSGADAETGFRPFRIEQPALELLGAEAIASLWADRGRVLRGSGALKGQLNLSRISFEEADLLAAWIARLTGANGEVDRSPRNANAPMLFLEQEDLLAMLQALRPTWMAQAPCLLGKFQPELPPPSKAMPRRSRRRRLALSAAMETGPAGAAPVPAERKRNRRIPVQRPMLPPLLNQAS
jgi:hypothetical protein